MDKNKKPFKYYRDLVANNPKYDRSVKDAATDKEVQRQKELMLYDANSSLEEKKKADTIKRMLSAYKKRKREDKIDKLDNNPKLWKGLENYEMNEDINSFITKLRRLYYTGKKLSFREWLDVFEDLLDELT